MRPLQTLLSKRFFNQKLGHFYILKSPNSRSQLPWMKELLSQIISKQSSISLTKASEKIELGHSDLLFIDKKSGDYSVKDGDFNEFFHFLNYRPVELGHKFIVVSNANKIPEILSNKLLKSLENPGNNCTIFFLSSCENSELPTISSRAISLNIDKDSVSQFEEPPVELTQEKLKEMLDSSTFDSETLKKFISGATHIFLSSSPNHQETSKFLGLLKEIEGAKTYNNQLRPLLQAVYCVAT